MTLSPGYHELPNAGTRYQALHLDHNSISMADGQDFYVFTATIQFCVPGTAWFSAGITPSDYNKTTVIDNQYSLVTISDARMSLKSVVGTAASANNGGATLCEKFRVAV
jgi:hypothetical protein